MSEPTEEEVVSVSMDKLAEVYIKIRDARQANKAKFEAEDSVLEDQMKMLAEDMLERCKELNADSIKTPHGTIVRSVKSRYWTNDWDSMYKFIKEQDAFGMLEKRLHQTNTKEFLAEHPDLLPAGLNVENEYTVVVRRAKTNQPE